MHARLLPGLMICALWFACDVMAQPTVPPPAPTPVVEPPPAKDIVAARVNGQPIPEMAVYRGTLSLAPAKRAERRKDVLNFLIDNTIVDQYLTQLKIEVDPKEIQEQVDRMKKETKNEKQEFSDLLKKLFLTEDELRTELMSALRWDKFVIRQGPEKVLQDLFEKNLDMFNGSKMHARHILIPVTDGKKEITQAKILDIKKAIEDEVARTTAKLPDNAAAIDREKERARLLEKVFADAAMKNSTCPSKEVGGDLGSFRRVGDMVEPFARAAYALKPYQLSDPVATEFGYHLILAIEYKPGKEVKFDQVKPYVQEVFAERLREAVLTYYKPKSKIEIYELKK